MANRDGYFPARVYAIVMGYCVVAGLLLTACLILPVLFVVAINLAHRWFGLSTHPISFNPLFHVIDAQRGVAPIFLLLGCLSAFVFTYCPFLEFWCRSWPVKIDEHGVTSFLLGRPLSALSWPEIRAITTFSGVAATGLTFEAVRLNKCKEFEHDEWADLQASRQRFVLVPKNPWRAYFRFRPRSEIWVTNYMAASKFRAACELLTRQASLHDIPLTSIDSGHGAAKEAKQIMQRIVAEGGRKRRRPFVVWRVDNL